MAARKQHSFFAFFLILVLCVNLLNVQTVHADGETPTEPPVATEVVTEEPADQPTEPPVESTPESVEATPLPEESTPEPVETEATATPVADILTQVPESTEVVVLDENGNSVPLATEEAAEITEMFDPMWCPAGVLPGGAGCSQNFASISLLINSMISNTTNYDANGIIYFAATTGSQTTGASLSLTNTTLGGGDFNTLNDFNLTLQGGWNGQNGGNATFTGTTNFGTNAVTVGTSGNPWIGNITLNNFSFNGVSSTNAVTVYTTSGDITLSNVDVAQQSGEDYAAFLNSTSGDITIQNGSSFDGDNTGSDESRGVSATTSTGSITISDTTFAQSSQNGGSYDGATLSAPTVTLTNVSSSSNDGDGITINNATLVTLNNVNASNNGSSNTGSGVIINGPSGTNVFVDGGTFSNNEDYGIQVGNTNNVTIYVQSTPTCTGNDQGCSNDTFVQADSTPPVITKTVTGTTGANGWYIGNVTVDWTVTDPESSFTMTGCVDTTISTDTAETTLSCSATSVGGTSSDSVTIKLDKIAPSLSLPSNIVQEATSLNGADVTYVASVNDNLDLSVTISCSPASGSIFPLGTTTVNCSSTDAAGNNANGSFNVTVQDSTAPVIIPTVTGTVGANGWYTSDVSVSWSITDAQTEIKSSTGCEAAALTDETTGVTLTCSATNNVDLVNSVSVEIKIDKTAPTNVLLSAAGTLGSNGWYTSAVTILTSGEDPISGVNCTADQIFSTDTPGIEVNGSCTNGAGMSTNAAPLTIKIDTTAPAIAYQGQHPAANGSGWNNTDVALTWECTDAVTTPVTQTLTSEAANQSATGTCTDLAGNTASDTQGGINIDKTAPTLQLPSDITAEAITANGVDVTYSASASDNLTPSIILTCNPASGSLFGLGQNIVNCSTIDLAGNSATGNFNVFVVDTTAPQLVLPLNITANATGPLGAAVSFTVTATDAVDGDVAVSCNPASGSNFPVGPNEVNCTATDDHNNQSSGSFFVNVQDPDAPSLSLPNNMTVEATGPGGATVNFSATATDIVDGTLPVTCAPASGSTFAFGTTTIHCHATDGSQNTTEAAFNITVQDTTAPVIAPYADITATTNSAAGMIVNYASPSTSDAVDGAGSASCTPASGTLFPLGDTEVNCTITDTHGNSASSTFSVHVKQNQTGNQTGTHGRTPVTSSSAFTIPLTGGELIGLDCNSVLWSSGVRLSFFNLCDHQAAINSLSNNDLPADLPEGFSFVTGLDVAVLNDGQLLESLPEGAGIELDFPLNGESADEFAVLFWDVESKEWVEVSEAIDADEISTTLDEGDGFYQIHSNSLADLYYQVLSAEKAGVFVLVKK